MPLEALGPQARPSPARQLALQAPWRQQSQQQQLLASHSVVALAAAWDQLAPRLPLQLGIGHGAELILNALKLALAATSGATATAAPSGSSSARSQHHHHHQQHDAVPPAGRALGVALRLADLASGGLPLDAEAIAAGLLAEALCWHGAPPAHTAHSLQLIERRVGPGVAQLVHDVLRVRALPSRVDLYDDEAARYEEVCGKIVFHVSISEGVCSV